MMYDLNMLKDFTSEASEHLDELESSLLQLEAAPDNRELLNDIFRSIHSIKGAAQFVGLERISELSHRLETLLELVRSDEMALDPTIFDILIAAKDLLAVLNGELETTQTEQSSIDTLSSTLDQLIDPSLAQPETGATAEPQPAAPSSGPSDSEDPRDLLQAESFFEEGDTELLEIFTGQLTEKVAALRSLPSETAPSEEKIRFLKSAAKHLGALRSAANYMGYDKLTGFYDRWQKTVDAALDRAEKNGTVALDGFTEFLEMLQERMAGIAIAAASGQADPDNTLPEPAEEIEDSVANFLESSPEDENPAVLPEDARPPVADHPSNAPTTSGALEPDVPTPAEPSPDETGLTGKKEPVVLHDPAALGDQLREESIADEEDLELQDIFTAQLSDKMAALVNVPPESAPQDEKIEFLKSAKEHLDALRSAANYMGYEKLVDFYDHWSASIDSALGAVALDGNVPLGFFISFLNILQDRFADIMPTDAPETDTSVGEDQAPDTESSIADAVDRLFADEPPDEDRESLANDQDPLPDHPASLTDHQESLTDTPQTGAVNHPEGNDAELYEIFINHATDGIRTLSRDMITPSGVVSGEDLDRSLNILEGLLSSANYMGYHDLCQIYTQWQAQATTARELSGEEDTVAVDFWGDYLNRVLEQLPRVADRLTDSPAPNTEPAAAVSPATSDMDIADDTDEYQEPVTPDRVLFDRLSRAFNTTLPTDREDDDGDIPLLEVLEEMIDGEDTITVPHFVIPDPPGESIGEAAGQEKNQPAQTTAAPAQAPESGQETKKTSAAAKNETAASSRKEDSGQPIEAQKARSGATMAKKFKQSFRVDADKIDYLMNQVGELVVSRAFFGQLYNDLRGLHQELKEELGLTQKELKPVREFSFRLGEATVALGRVSNELQEGVMKARMLPISQLFARYPRLARDLVHNTDKQVTINTHGEDTELDKMIIEAISDPLIHIIRNAIDHGIEPADERRRLGKPAAGTLTLEAYHESNHIVIEVTDDGRGIDLNRIRAKAIAGGLGTEEDFNRLPNRELMRLIMTPGFSTADQATRTSGRGVGMDVVRKNIEKLSGSIEIESEAGQQTRIRIKIPLTLAIIAALLVRVGEDIFTIPLSSVEETIRLYESDITTIEGIEVIHLRDKTTPILRLSSIFGLPSSSQADGKNFIVIVNTGSQHVGLVVDTLIGQEEVVIKPLPDYLREQSGFSGATIIGDGGISLILDVYELVNMTIRKKKKNRMHMAPVMGVTPQGRPALEAPTLH